MLVVVSSSNNDDDDAVVPFLLFMVYKRSLNTNGLSVRDVYEFSHPT